MDVITTSVLAAWIIFAVLLFILFVAAANDSLSTLVWFTIIGFLVLQFVTVADPFGWAMRNPWAVAMAVIAYIPAGVGWSTFRWWKLLNAAASDIREEKPNYKPRWSTDTWEKYVSDNLPKPSRHKEEIILWIAYWPFSLLAYALIDFLQELGELVYAKISKIYQSMADRIKATLLD